ncbi:MAG: site-specific tyrosine recombinase [Lachnospiraceae bacterium]|jgi:integrase/recombinase XerD
MQEAIQSFIKEIHNNKNSSLNTEVSYERDLKKLAKYLETEHSLKYWEDVTETNLNSYMLFLESRFAASTVCRSIASIRAFFKYLTAKGVVGEDPSLILKPPKIEKKAPLILSVNEIDKLLSAPDVKTAKGIRDKAMLELLYATGMRVTELISLKVNDLNLKMDYVVCRERTRERIIPFGSTAKAALKKYLSKGRDMIITDSSADEGYLFTNVRGSMMTRQGFWKVIKSYALQAGISGDITPHTLRHSFAMHMIQNGSDLKSLQEMLGHSDISTTHFYENIGLSHMRNVYNKSHPRK